MSIKFIAEVSSNHSKKLQRSLEFIDIAAKIGCDSVKFQLFRIDQLFSPEVLARSEKLKKRKEWELPSEFIPILADRCKKKAIQFGCTPFYLDAVKELEPYVDFYKVASYELLWDDLLTACAETKKPVIISTGMATIDEIIHAVEILKKNKCTPTILHCTSAYPSPHTEANLAAIAKIYKETGCEVGWSDHTVNPGVINRAIHKWNAKVIEFHLDLDGKGEEYDTGHCWLPDEIARTIQHVKHAFEADGDGNKKPSNAELPDREWRADPSDGLRPIRSIRDTCTPP